MILAQIGQIEVQFQLQLISIYLRAFQNWRRIYQRQKKADAAQLNIMSNNHGWSKHLLMWEVAKVLNSLTATAGRIGNTL